MSHFKNSFGINNLIAIQTVEFWRLTLGAYDLRNFEPETNKKSIIIDPGRS